MGGHAGSRAQQGGQQHGAARGTQGEAGLEDGERQGHCPPHPELVPTGVGTETALSPSPGKQPESEPTHLGLTRSPAWSAAGRTGA